jgi:hypothetical protein
MYTRIQIESCEQLNPGFSLLNGNMERATAKHVRHIRGSVEDGPDIP